MENLTQLAICEEMNREMKGVIQLCNRVQAEKEAIGDDDAELWFLVHQIVAGWHEKTREFIKI